MKHLEVKIINFTKALNRLKAVLVREEDDVKIDVCIKRCEFTYELCWKTMQSALRELGIIASNPRDIFDKASKQELIDNVELWLRMKDDRNDTSHEYDEKKAAEIYSRIAGYAKEFELVLERLRKI
jgi:nucleotidyltransferase substrate binding protein (TIGR01987 family)